MLTLRDDLPLPLKAPNLDTALVRIDRVAAVDGAQAATARAEMLGLQTTGARVEVEIGLVTCSWKLPVSAAGRRVSGTVRAHTHGLSVVRRFSVVVGSR
jgi:hypothetical protein